MTPSIKKLCIYGLATGVGQMLQSQSRDEQVQWRALKLSEAGQDLIDHCKIRIDNSMLSRVEKKIDEICKNKGQYDVVEMLSFLILGVQELQHYSDSEQLKTLEKRALWFTRLFDPKLKSDIHEIAYKRYERWVA